MLKKISRARLDALRQGWLESRRLLLWQDKRNLYIVYK